MGVGCAQARVFWLTRRRSGRRRSVLPTAALRSVRVSVLLVLQLHCGGGVCKLGCGGAGDGRAVGTGFQTRRNLDPEEHYKTIQTGDHI